MANGEHFPRNWEIISENLKRLRVPDGWIIKDESILLVGGKVDSISIDMFFFSDPHKRWVLEDRK